MKQEEKSTLTFGTGGIRALMGEGDGKINGGTIARMTQGLAFWVKAQSLKPSVLVGFDARINSHAFAKKTAQVLAGNGIRVFLLKDIRPTPYISFASIHHGCTAAVMITASHNPKEYNGYKVYGADGGQLTSPHDIEVAQAMQRSDPILEAPLHSPLIQVIEGDVDSAYLQAVFSLQKQQTQNKQHGNALHIVYSNLHGVGITLAPQALSMWGFAHVDLVEAQRLPDGTFPTVRFPNPEYPETLALGIAEIEKSGADILIATDPDADRMGVSVMHKGRSVILTGNELAALFLDYLCRFPLPKNPAFVKTVVTTDLCRNIAKDHGIACFDVLTGFKYIAEKIQLWQTDPQGYDFIFGAEESYGYLFAPYTRDKDGVAAACFISEIALDAKLHNKTLVDRLEEIYRTYGMYREKQLSIPYTVEAMHTLRKQPPADLGGHRVSKIEDFLTSIGGLPPADMLIFYCEGGIKLIVRPSGTEPKVKLYAAVFSSPAADAEAVCDTKLQEVLTQASQLFART